MSNNLRVGQLLSLARANIGWKSNALDLRRHLHLVAATTLFLLAFFHLGAVIRDLAFMSKANPVFPFLTNGVVLTASSLIEAALAAICFRNRGASPADSAIFSFLFLILWYRVGMNVTNPHGYSCSCMGILTVLLGLTMAQEKRIADLVLAVMFICGGPGFLSRLRWPGVRRCVGILVLTVVFVFPRVLCASLAIEGHFQYTYCDPMTGARVPDSDGIVESESFLFSTILDDDRWRISVTNSANPTMWTDLSYDGTNTYWLCPCIAPFVNSREARSNSIYVTVSDSPLLLLPIGDWAYSYIPWVTYGLNLRKIPKDRFGSWEIPLPWKTPRLNLFAYGWAWNIEASADGRFVASCSVNRDTNLDLNTPKQEMLRPELDYAEDVASLNFDNKALQIRRLILSGFTEMRYQCKTWFSTNNMTVPIKAEMEEFPPLLANSSSNRFPICRTSLDATVVRVRRIGLNLLDPTNYTRVVKDYRYKRASASRIYKRAEYVLAPGQPWQGPDNPRLRAAAEEYLLRGPKYDAFEHDYKHIFLWSAGAIVLFGPAIYLYRDMKQQKSKGAM